MPTYDFSPLFRSTIGFDRLFNLAQSMDKTDQSGPSYPPYDIAMSGDNAYRITMAVAGFSEDELDVEVRENTLTVAGKRNNSDIDTIFLHRGIAGRDFVRKFELADHMKIKAAHLRNGMLSIDLMREMPEEMKPRHIEIKSGEPDGFPQARTKKIKNASK